MSQQEWCLLNTQSRSEFFQRPLLPLTFSSHKSSGLASRRFLGESPLKKSGGSRGWSFRYTDWSVFIRGPFCICWDGHVIYIPRWLMLYIAFADFHCMNCPWMPEGMYGGPHSCIAPEAGTSLGVLSWWRRTRRACTSAVHSYDGGSPQTSASWSAEHSWLDVDFPILRCSVAMTV